MGFQQARKQITLRWGMKEKKNRGKGKVGGGVEVRRGKKEWQDGYSISEETHTHTDIQRKEKEGEM